MINLDLHITKSSLLVSKMNPVECFEVYTKYDTNIKGSQYNLSLVIPDSLQSLVIASQQNIIISVEDSHGNGPAMIIAKIKYCYSLLQVWHLI